MTKAEMMERGFACVVGRVALPNGVAAAAAAAPMARSTASELGGTEGEGRGRTAFKYL